MKQFLFFLGIATLVSHAQGIRDAASDTEDSLQETTEQIAEVRTQTFNLKDRLRHINGTLSILNNTVNKIDKEKHELARTIKQLVSTIESQEEVIKSLNRSLGVANAKIIRLYNNTMGNIENRVGTLEVTYTKYNGYLNVTTVGVIALLATLLILRSIPGEDFAT